MAELIKGMRGDDVRRLQERLLEIGFPPGPIDGIFGPATEQAVRNFQASQGLLVDGRVGPQTSAALAVDITPDPPFAMAGVTIARVQKGFAGTPRRLIEANLPFVLTALDGEGLGDKPMVLMALATIRAETSNFQPIDEFISRFNTSPNGHPFDLYDNRQDLGNKGRPDGERFKGRGYIQLTGRFNYGDIGKRIGVALVGNPERANEPEVAAAILASFLKRGERRIREALLDHNLKSARKAVNGGTHGITRFTDSYRALDKAIPD